MSRDCSAPPNQPSLLFQAFFFQIFRFPYQPSKQREKEKGKIRIEKPSQRWGWGFYYSKLVYDLAEKRLIWAEAASNNNKTMRRPKNYPRNKRRKRENFRNKFLACCASSYSLPAGTSNCFPSMLFQFLWIQQQQSVSLGMLVVASSQPSKSSPLPNAAVEPMAQGNFLILSCLLFEHGGRKNSTPVTTSTCLCYSRFEGVCGSCLLFRRLAVACKKKFLRCKTPIWRFLWDECCVSEHNFRFWIIAPQMKKYRTEQNEKFALIWRAFHGVQKASLHMHDTTFTASNPCPCSWSGYSNSPLGTIMARSASCSMVL